MAPYEIPKLSVMPNMLHLMRNYLLIWCVIMKQQEALEGYRSCTMAVNANPEEVRKRAMADPEVQAIMRDPAMRLILEQMQNDPKALQE